MSTHIELILACQPNPRGQAKMNTATPENFQTTNETYKINHPNTKLTRNSFRINNALLKSAGTKCREKYTG